MSNHYPFAEVEPRWQRYWERARDLPRRRAEPAEPKYYVLDMFPYPSRRGPARRPPRGLHRHRHRLPLQAHARLQRAAPDGLGRLRPARRAVRHQDRHAPARSPPRATSPTSAARSKRSASPTTGTARSTPPTPTTTAGRSGSSSSSTSAGLAYEAEVPVNWCPALGTVLANEEVIDGKSERRRLPGRAPADAPVDAADHRLRRAAARGPRRCSTGPSTHQGDAAQLDRPLRGRRGRLPRSTGATSTLTRLHHPARHAVRRDLHGARARAPAGRRASPTPAQRAAVEAYREAAARKSDLRAHRARPRRRPASSPAPTRSTRSTASSIPIWIADYVLMGYGTGAIMAVPGARRARLRVRREVRPARSSRWSPGGDVARRAVDADDGRRRQPSTPRRPRRPAAPPRPSAQITAWLEARGRGAKRGQLQAARLALLPPALLGRAVPDRPPARTAAMRAAARERAAACCCPSSSDFKPTGDGRAAARAASTEWVNDDRSRDRQAGAARDQHHAAVGRLVLVLPALHRPDERRERCVDPAKEQLLDAGRPLRRRRRARRAAPALRPLLAQGALRPRPRHARPSRSSKLRQPGHDPRRGRREDVQVAAATSSTPTTSSPSTAPTRCGSTRCSWARSRR